LNLVERFKTGLSSRTILWYHYIDGIGEKLILAGQDTITISFFNSSIRWGQVHASQKLKKGLTPSSK
jgi:hypothetical protein